MIKDGQHPKGTEVSVWDREQTEMALFVNGIANLEEPVTTMNMMVVTRQFRSMLCFKRHNDPATWDVEAMRRAKP